MTNKVNLIGGEPDLTWALAPDGFDRAIIGGTLEGDEREIRRHLEPQTAQALVEAHNQDLAALSVWWRRQNEAQLAYLRSRQL